MVKQGRRGVATRRTVWHDEARPGGAGVVGQRKARFGSPGQARHGKDWLGEVGTGKARQARDGADRRGKAGLGLARLGRAGMVWRGRQKSPGAHRYGRAGDRCVWRQHRNNTGTSGAYER